jgi:hypothetical protein
MLVIVNVTAKLYTVCIYTSYFMYLYFTLYVFILHTLSIYTSHVMYYVFYDQRRVDLKQTLACH